MRQNCSSVTGRGCRGRRGGLIRDSCRSCATFGLEAKQGFFRAVTTPRRPPGSVGGPATAGPWCTPGWKEGCLTRIGDRTAARAGPTGYHRCAHQRIHCVAASGFHRPVGPPV